MALIPERGSSWQSQCWFWWACLFEGLLGGAAMLGGYWTHLPTLSAIRWSIPDWMWGLAATIPLLILFWRLFEVQSPWGRSLCHFLETIVAPLFRPCSKIQLALISVLAGVGEELLFRALLQTWLAGRVGSGGGLLLASLLFGLVHWITPAYAIIAGLIGLYLGLWWSWSENLLVPITAHAAYDFLALVYLLQRHSEESSPGA